MKVITKLMRQEEIYQLTNKLFEQFDNNEIRMPAAIAYGIQKNKKLFFGLAQEIEQNRYDILQHYGTLQEDGTFIVPQNLIQQANDELNTLLQIQEEVKIYVITIEELEGIDFTMSQIDTLMFMILEEEEYNLI